MRAANQVVKKKPPTKLSMDKPICHQGTVLGIPKGMRTIIIIGDVKGIILPHTAIGPEGSFNTAPIIIIEKIMGIIKGKLSDWASRISSFTALPAAANKEA